MSLLLPQQTILGNLEMLEVYEFYDKPCLFSCRNLAGQIYLAVWIDESEQEDSWLYVPVSAHRLLEVTAGDTALRNAFLRAEDGFVFQVITHHNNGSEVVGIACANLEGDRLPAPEAFLSCPSEIARHLLVREDVGSVAL